MTARANDPTSELTRRLGASVEGDLLFDRFSRGRYATDASIYQMQPLGVVVPKNWHDVLATLDIARDVGVPVLPRGGGTSQCGQTVNRALVVDFTKHLHRLVEIDLEASTARVEPGLVLDRLNAQLKPHGLWFPVDISTASRATIGGMTANNSCGSRSIRYGTMRDNVVAIDAILADGSEFHFSTASQDRNGRNDPGIAAGLVADLADLGRREADEIQARFPDLMRRVGGYNIDALVPRPDGGAANLSHLLVGSEGTLAVSKQIELRLAPLPDERVLGVCHFATFRGAMEAARHIVELGPTAVELIDRTMIELTRAIPMLGPTIDQFVRGAPAALLLVEFAETDPAENRRRLKALEHTMAELGWLWGDAGHQAGGVLEATDPGLQARIWEVRKQGLNIMMSMKSDGKPVSFVEDCAVRVEDLPDYTERLSEIFRKHDTDGTWYAHASVGTLHVRPILNLKLDADVRAMRAIAEETFEMVRDYKGSHSGEHGDGIVRSEFHREMFGDRIVGDFEWVKDRMDPAGLLNPGKIVRPPKMDDRTLFRYPPDYRVPPFDTALDWSAHTGAGGGFQGAVEMCNSNGACRKLADGGMCPSFRVTGNERDVVRGRAASLRLAISGQLGPGAVASDEMADTMRLCVSCKACRSECPTGVDMAAMKIEVMAARAKAHGLPFADRLIATLPRWAPTAAKFAWAMNLRDAVPGLARLLQPLTGFSASRSLPRWHADRTDRIRRAPDADNPSRVMLFADTFNRYFAPQTLADAARVLTRAGHPPALAAPADRSRPLCCGRTFLTHGLIAEAKAELARSIAVIKPFIEAGGTIVGLEPSCILTFRDEAVALLGNEWTAEHGARVLLFEEYVAAANQIGDFDLPLAPLAASRVAVHGHCHQKAFDLVDPVVETLGLIPDLQVDTITASCCGMAGAFGYRSDTVEISRSMGELGLLPAVRAAGAETLIVADGISCRHQIALETDRQALHAAELLCQSCDIAEQRKL